MAAVLRTGLHGQYYGNTYTTSNPLTPEQQKVNAGYIYYALTSYSWSVNAIAAILANMEAESSINPGRWQGDNVGGGPAYGLVQWDPFTKYTEWAVNAGFSDPSEMDSNLARIQYEIENGLQWIPVGAYYDLSFKEFSRSARTPGDLAKAFLLCYERPLDQSESVQAYRASLANAWYTYITGSELPEPGPSEPIRKAGKFNFILFNRSKSQWQYKKRHIRKR